MTQLKWTRRSQGRNYLTRNYEPLQPHLLLQLARHLNSDSFIDVGANIGLYSILFAQHDTIKTVHAFEPSPETFAELRRNIALNGLERRVETHRIAASSRSGLVTFGVVDSLSGANSIVDTSIHEQRAFAREVKVDAAALDDYLDLDRRRLCIKIDVEGHEMEALRGMRRLLTENEVILQIERYGSEENELRETLEQYGLRELFAIRADRYFASQRIAPVPDQIIRIFENAAADLIEENLAELTKQFASWGEAWPLTLTIPRLVTIQLLGKAAAIPRKIRRAFRRS